MIKLLKKLSRAQVGLLVLLVFFVLGQAACDLILPSFMGEIIGGIQDQRDMAFIWTNGAYMLLVALGSALFNVLVCLLAGRISAGLCANIRHDLFVKINNFSADEMNKFSTSSLITRSTNDITQIQISYNQVLRFLIYAPMISIGAILIVVFRSWELSVVVFIGVLVLVALLIILFVIAVPKYNSIQGKTDKVNLVSRENLTGLRVIRAYNAEKVEEEKFEVINDDLTKTQRFVNRCTGIINPGMQFIMGILSLALVWIGAYLVKGGNLDYADLSVFTIYSNQILMGFMVVAVLLVILPRAIVCGKRINEVLDMKISIIDSCKDASTKEEGSIEFKNVSFKYKGSEKNVLQDISFKANKGDVVAFIGSTGSGKSTILNLIMRFFDVSSGSVLIDGVNVKDYKLEDIYKKIGYVPQKGMLFKGSLEYNVSYGKLDASDKDIDEALEVSESVDFVSKLPNGKKYEISQGGKNVSGGQRQRLSIARAIITKPEILIFDDSFSALDYKTDKKVRENLDIKFSDTTRLIVAQRIGTIIDADLILVLDDGKIVGAGKHKELLKECATYKDIALSQLSKEELENA